MEAKVMTPFQATVLTTLFESGLRDRDYCFTGGTALAEFYLQHRHSDDLDIFTRARRSIKADYLEIKHVLEDKALEASSEIEEDEFVRFFVRGAEETGQGLKIELARYAGAQMSPGRLSKEYLLTLLRILLLTRCAPSTADLKSRTLWTCSLFFGSRRLH